MRLSIDRILTTHVGSMPRPQALVDALLKKDRGEAYDAAAYDGIERFAAIVGRERVLAGSDCGFGAFAGYGKLDGEIAYKKLKALADGARIASERLWT